VALDDPWLASAWRFVHPHLPPAPATVVEIGCGRLGGFVPELTSLGYDAVGIDPHAPEGPAYRQVRFEDADPLSAPAAVIASTSLHHVDDLDEVADRLAATLPSGAPLVVIEWAWERFDVATAAWCFSRLPGDEGGARWLRHHREGWRASGRAWADYLAAWIAAEGLHASDRILAVLDERFERVGLETGPYYFADLAGTSEREEQAAIDAGEIQPGSIRYVATRP
jgi:SAM-dependent methyltransferase